MPKAVWDEIVGVNLTGMYLSCKHGVAAIKATAGKGAVVITGSPTGILGCTPASIASSIMANAKPVFPDPVWPTMTAWVVSAAGASATGVAVRAWVVASTLSPR